MEQSIYFEISQGSENKMYTLWRVTSSNLIYNRVFIQNLSIDKEIALSKAKELANGREILDDSLDTLNEIIREDSGKMTFGKYKGQEIISLPNNYLIWLSQGGPIQKNIESSRGYTSNETYTDYISPEKITNFAKDEALKRNLIIEYNGKFISLDYYNRIILIKEMEAKSNHFGNIGDKFKNIKVKLQSVKECSTAYGMTYLNKLLTEDGNILIYFGNDLRGNYITYEYYDILTNEKININDHKKSHFENIGITEGRYHTYYGTYNMKAEIEEVIKSNMDFIENHKLSCDTIILSKKPILAITKNVTPYYENEIGSEFKLSFTIKNHSVYNDTKQTNILRPKITK